MCPAFAGFVTKLFQILLLSSFGSLPKALSTFFDTVPSLLGFRMYSHHLCGSSSRVVHLGLPLCVFPFIPPSRISFNSVSPHITRPIHHPPSLLWMCDRSILLPIDDSNMKAVSSLYMQLLLLLLLLVTVWPARVSGDHSGLGRIPQATRRRTLHVNY